MNMDHTLISSLKLLKILLHLKYILCETAYYYFGLLVSNMTIVPMIVAVFYIRTVIDTSMINLKLNAMFSKDREGFQ